MIISTSLLADLNGEFDRRILVTWVDLRVYVEELDLLSKVSRDVGMTLSIYIRRSK